MSDYRRIAGEFKKIGREQSSELTESQIKVLLDKIGHNNIGLREFDPSVAQELFEQVQKSQQNKALLSNYIKTIIRAHEMLRKNIDTLREKIRLDRSMKNDETLEELHQFHQDLRLLTIPFGLKQPDKIPELEGLDMSQQGLTEKIGVTERTIEINDHKETEGKDLIALIIITVIALVLDLISGTVKNNFINILAELIVLSIFLLKAFDKHFIRTCITAIIVSILQEIIWMLVIRKVFEW